MSDLNDPVLTPAQREAIFLREFRAKHAVWGSTTPYGIPTNAPEPRNPQSSPGSDDGSGQKA